MTPPNLPTQVQQPAVETLVIPGGRVYFAPERRGRGRPSRIARDVAAYAAHEWFHSGRPMPGVRDGVRSAITAVHELWAAKGYHGLSDRKETVGALKRGEAIVSRQQLDAVVREVGEANGARTFFVPNRAVQQDAGGIQISFCIGWLWVFGNEEAQPGRISTCRDDFSP